MADPRIIAKLAGARERAYLLLMLCHIMFMTSIRETLVYQIDLALWKALC